MKKIYFLILRKIPRKYLIIFSYVFSKLIVLFYKGNKYECPVCETKFRKLLSYGVWSERKNALCPKCLSLERHRLLWLYLKNQTGFFTDHLKVLHIAPEQSFLKSFKKLSNLDYTTADIESPIADVKMDIQDMPFDDNAYDVVICNHVLEHIPDEKKAMSEILRVLKPNAFAILFVPIDFSFETTFEDPKIQTEADREKYYHQKDHVRLYGKDYPEVLKQNGFEIRDKNYTDSLSEAAKEKYCIQIKEYMYAYYKPA